MAPRAGEKPMNRTTRRARFALPTALAALVATGFSAASLAAGCGSGQTNDAACALGSEGCPCDSPGVTVDCSESVNYIPGSDTTQCRSGKRTCDGGKWGACVGTKRSFQSVPAAVLKSGTATACTSNPCDPGCQVFVDTGGDIDASAVTTNEAGGISLTPQEAGVVGNWDGGAPTCTGLQCQIKPCIGQGGYTATKLSGAVYDPAGKNPIPNVLVYVPNATPTVPSDGLTCDACQAATGNAIVQAVTDYKGEFTLTGVPSGANIPLVIQSGKWFRQITVPSITQCVTNAQTTGTNPATTPLIRFPKNRSEGHIPRIAFMSGRIDPFECVLLKMGLDANGTGEFSKPVVSGSPAPQRIHWYNSDWAAGQDLSSGAGGPGVLATTLVDSPTRLAWYDAVILSCEGKQFARTTAEYQNLIDYTKAGGRVFATHFSYAWLQFPDPASLWPSTVNEWYHTSSYSNPLTENYIDQSFAKGATFAKWLNFVGASPTLGKLTIDDPRRDYDAVNPKYAQRWMTSRSDNSTTTVSGVSSGGQCSSSADCNGSSSCGGQCLNGASCHNGTTCGSVTNMCTTSSDCFGPHKYCGAFTSNVCAITTMRNGNTPPAGIGNTCSASAACGAGTTCTGFCQDGTSCTASATCGKRTRACKTVADCTGGGAHDACTGGGGTICAVQSVTNTGSTLPAGVGTSCTATGTCADGGTVCTTNANSGSCSNKSSTSCTADAACNDLSNSTNCRASADCGGTGAQCDPTSGTQRYCVAKPTAANYTRTACVNGYCSNGTVCGTGSTCSTGQQSKTCTADSGCDTAHDWYCGFSGTSGTHTCTNDGTCTGVTKTCTQETGCTAASCGAGEYCAGDGKCYQQTTINKIGCDNNLCPDGVTSCTVDANCSNLTKACTGAGHGDCTGPNTYCVSSASIANNAGTLAAYTGYCTDAGTVGVCDATCLQSTCGVDADCGAGNWCNAGTCVVQQAGTGVGKCDGGVCADGSTCASDADCGARTQICSADSDCSSPNAKCVPSTTGVAGYGNICVYADNSGWSTKYYTNTCDGTCSTSSCTKPADCEAGYNCVSGSCTKDHDMEPLMTFNVPVGAAAASQCGRVVFSDFHVAAGALSGTSGFPASCDTSGGANLSPQEKALEYMLFDLTSCISPDYIPPGGGGGPAYSVPMAVTRDYTASCPTGTAPVWHFFDWATHTPGDSSIQFLVQTGPSTSALLPSTALPLATVSGATVPPWLGQDVATTLAAASPAVVSGAVLRVTIVLKPTTDGTQSPTLDAWRQSYDCVAVE
jgi:hypothetical protein